MPDWTNDRDYDWTDNLSRREWAWEFLRRNAAFRATWGVARLQYGISGYDGSTTMLVCAERTPSLSPWGCLYCSTPEGDAREATVFWLPDLCPSVLRLNAFPLAENIAATPFWLREIVSMSILLEFPDGPQHLLFVEGERSLQLAIFLTDPRLIGVRITKNW